MGGLLDVRGYLHHRGVDFFIRIATGKAFKRPPERRTLEMFTTSGENRPVLG